MKFLIDTNILIPLEPGSLKDLVPSSEVAGVFLANVQRSKSEIFIHPAILEDIKRDKNIERKTVRSRLLPKYRSLAPVLPASVVMDAFGNPATATNDWVDACLLSAVYANAVDHLITEDADIHRRARRLNCHSRVLRLQEAAALVQTLFDHAPPPPPAVNALFAYELNVEDGIFDSFRHDYPSFDEWLDKCRLEHRICWTIRNNAMGGYAGLAIVKPEVGPIFGMEGKILKICSFKVSDRSIGQRYGELLLKTVFEYANHNACDWVYVTAFDKQAALIEFLGDFGFDVHAEQNANKELVLKKPLRPRSEDHKLSPLESHIKYGPPHLSDEHQDVYVVPIQPHFHRVLFPEAESELELFPGFISCGNGLRKAYLTNSQMKSVPPGSLLAFYRSKDHKEIRMIGIVEATSRFSLAEDVVRYVGNRTVYSFDEIESMTRKDVLAILFRQVKILRRSLSYHELRERGILTGPPQSLLRVEKERCKWLNRIIKKPS